MQQETPLRPLFQRKYRLEEKGITIVIEELKQRIIAKANKVKTYKNRIEQYRQNRLSRVNQGRFYEELEKVENEDRDDQEAEESIQFWNGIWGKPIENGKDADWVKKIREEVETEELGNMTIDLERLRSMLKRIAN